MSKISTPLAFSIIVALAAFFGLLAWLMRDSIWSGSSSQNPIPGFGVACTREAKLCSDGKTYVSRTGPDCEFSACPNENTDPTVCVCDDGDFCPCRKVNPGRGDVCVDQCGDGVCQQIVCLGTGCTCSENANLCPQDCRESR